MCGLAIPAALFIKRYSYKHGILIGLLLYGIGCLLFLPAGASKAFGAFLGIFAFCVIAAFFNPVWEWRTVSLYFWLFAGMTIKLAGEEHISHDTLGLGNKVSDSGFDK